MGRQVCIYVIFQVNVTNVLITVPNNMQIEIQNKLNMVFVYCLNFKYFFLVTSSRNFDSHYLQCFVNILIRYFNINQKCNVT